ncbi:glycosyltransferase family 2 protein [Xenorhabdus bovienii]|uniref:glycosyltransferase family 2 protein n=1 Tax=Xenorhabdus bovienii TaxID=40576 RepID=UPI0023B2EA2A|nr:glycosyltransferase family 2 protein [Xenorhabdus bovienii]MDE9461684.1 glycosyltransferase family 2 protein [Xenorhabdus bovienii]MDE9469874.1 glycosyltransferase family 2 protein [Xenorhabdus bovienii]MDE9534050.1 glycosyltransferase family 2 protein [Xenorhabdus bovienii]MDE9586979.1 glycosyltransferase family 2 protein [Xenorhabdus bovienii]
MIIIPMAGLSSRFFSAGFDKPKYMLDAHGKTLFEHSVLSFSNYFESKKFVFIIRDIYDTVQFVTHKVKQLGIEDYYIHVLKDETRGQAETVALALKSLESQHVNLDKSITIFNIDTFRPNFIYPKNKLDVDGYLEVFVGNGNNWSYIKPYDKSEFVELTTEKVPVSNLCSTGLYHFSKIADYVDAFEFMAKLDPQEWTNNELYIAPMYNYLIKKGKKIKFNIIERENAIFCGTPDEYYDFLHH